MWHEIFLIPSIHFQKLQCPKCSAWVVDIPRHMRSKKHAWDPTKATYARVILGIKNEGNTSKKNRRRYKKCNVPGCSAEVKRLDKHMKARHGQLDEEKRHATFKDLILNKYIEWMNSRDSGMDREQTRSTI